MPAQLHWHIEGQLFVAYDPQVVKGDIHAGVSALDFEDFRVHVHYLHANPVRAGTARADVSSTEVNMSVNRIIVLMVLAGLIIGGAVCIGFLRYSPGTGDHEYGLADLRSDLLSAKPDDHERGRQWILADPTPEKIEVLIDTMDARDPLEVILSDARAARSVNAVAKEVLHKRLHALATERIGAGNSSGWDWQDPMDWRLMLLLTFLSPSDEVLNALRAKGLWGEPLTSDYSTMRSPGEREQMVIIIRDVSAYSLNSEDITH